LRRVAIVAALVLGRPAPADAAFERLPVGPEAAALGEVVATSTDPVFGNPAPPVRAGGAPSIAVRAWASRPFAIPELVEAQASASFRLGRFGSGFGFRRFGSASYAEKELRLAVGWTPAAGASIGAAARGLVVEGLGFAPRRSLAVDAGLRVRPSKEAELSALLEAALGEVPGDPEGTLRRTAIGVVRRLGDLEVRIEVQRREDRPIGGVVGAEWAVAPALVLRAGAREDPASAAWGFSLRLAGMELSASATHAALGRSLRVGIAVPGTQP
jgi:hypothetical protein